MTGPKSRASGASERAGFGARLRAALSSALAWDILLALIILAWSLEFIRLFSPGRVNVDIAEQYRQATGKDPFTDWHPPVMGVVWRALIEVTGQVGSLLVLQVSLLAAAAWLLGVLVHRTGAPRWVSLLGPAMMAAPWIVSQMTTLWKDTQMAVALLLGMLLLAITRFVPKAWILWLPALSLLVYAVGVRKNTVFAVVPIAVYGGWCLFVRWRHRRGPTAPTQSTLARRGRPVLLTAAMSLVVLALIGAGVKITEAAIDSQVGVEKTGQISQIFLDDVMFSVPESRLQASDAPQELKDHISSARHKCLERGEIWDAYWNCYGRGTTGRAFSPIAYQDELRSLWLSEVITHPANYLEYRASVFSYYFFTSKLEYWEAGWDGDAEEIGFDTGNPRADYIFRPYVEDFALGTFPMLFKPWFWTIIAVVLLGLGYRSHKRSRRELSTVVGRHSASDQASGRASVRGPVTDGRRTADRIRSFWPEITALAASALCYIVGYFPIVPANHFRYTFWPALGLTAAVVLGLAMWRRGVPQGPRESSADGDPSGDDASQAHGDPSDDDASPDGGGCSGDDVSPDGGGCSHDDASPGDDDASTQAAATPPSAASSESET